MAQYALIMLLAGIGIPILAALNAALGTRLGNPAAAATVLFLVALAASTLVFVLGGAQGLGRLAAAPRHLLLGGVLVALADKFGLPIHAIGVGEKIDDLQPFDPSDFADALVGVDQL